MDCGLGDGKNATAFVAGKYNNFNSLLEIFTDWEKQVNFQNALHFFYFERPGPGGPSP